MPPLERLFVLEAPVPASSPMRRTRHARIRRPAYQLRPAIGLRAAAKRSVGRVTAQDLEKLSSATHASSDARDVFAVRDLLMTLFGLWLESG